MTYQDLLKAFSSNLYFAIKDDIAYVLDSYRLGDVNYNYGIYTEMPVEELKNPTGDEFGYYDVIPDIYFNDTLDFLLREDLEQTYNFPKDVVKELEGMLFGDWAKYLKENHPDLYENFPFTEYCEFFHGDIHLQGMSEEEIQKIIELTGNYDLKNIEKCEKQYEEMEM